MASTTSCFSPGSCTTRSGRSCVRVDRALAAVDLLVEIDVPQHSGGLDHPAQLDLAPLAAGAVGPQRGFQGMGGAQQLLIGQPGLLQLLGQLAVLLQAVAFQQGHLLLHRSELLRHRRQGTQHAAVLVAGLAQLPVLRRQKPPLGVGRGELRADLGKPGRDGVEVLLPRRGCAAGAAR